MMVRAKLASSVTAATDAPRQGAKHHTMTSQLPFDAAPEKALRRATLSDPGLCDDDSASATSGATGTISLGDWGLGGEAGDADLSPLDAALEALYEKRCVDSRLQAGFSMCNRAAQAAPAREAPAVVAELSHALGKVALMYVLQGDHAGDRPGGAGWHPGVHLRPGRGFRQVSGGPASHSHSRSLAAGSAVLPWAQSRRAMHHTVALGCMAMRIRREGWAARGGAVHCSAAQQAPRIAVPAESGFPRPPAGATRWPACS